MKTAKHWLGCLNAEEEGFEPFFQRCSKIFSYVQIKPFYHIELMVLTSFDHF